MRKELMKFTGKNVAYIFGGSLSKVLADFPAEEIVIITDENVFAAHKHKLEGYNTITVVPGEIHKQQKTIDTIIDQLLESQMGKQTVIVGMGGGVVTDMAGYVASIYKRGVKLLQVPTSILAMVDAAVGGKNGVDVGPYKNQVGTIYQPDLLLFDYDLLSTLPHEEWINGFAEIIKHACIKDAELFTLLAGKTIEDFKTNIVDLATLIERNVAIKTNVVLNDEFETGDRKLLNFGHTIGHAIENMKELPHGHAVSIGMMAACKLSEEMNGFSSVEKQQVEELLSHYHLPVSIDYDKEKMWQVLLIDKKREKESMNFILLNKIGEAVIKPIPLVQLKDLVEQIL